MTQLPHEELMNAITTAIRRPWDIHTNGWYGTSRYKGFIRHTMLEEKREGVKQ